MAPGVVEAHVPGAGGIDPRTRERILVAVADRRHDPLAAWVHRTWLSFLGPGSVDEGDPVTEPLVAYAASSIDAGAPLDPTTLLVVYQPAVVRSLRASIARAELQSGLGVLGRPTLLPEAAVAVLMRSAQAIVPRVPTAEVVDDEANLVVHLLAGSLPVLLGNTVLRALLLWNPVPVAIGVRPTGDDDDAVGAAATLRIGQGRVEIVSGLRPDALVVIDGGLEALLRYATGDVVRQARASETRRGR